MSELVRRAATVAACLMLAAAATLALAGCSGSSEEPSSSSLQGSGTTTLLMYAGSASKPPTEEAIRLFEQKTGIKVEVVFGGSGTVLSQMKLAKEGDLYFPGSSDFMEKAKKEGDVIAETEAKVVYLVPAINVQKGNPKSVKALIDLTRPGVSVAIANPETVCVGLYAVEIIEKNLSAAEKAAFHKNLLNYTESCEKTATAISLRQVDAVLGWSVFEHWNPEAIQTIPLPASQVARIGYIPIAVATYSHNRPAAQRFIDFLLSEEGQAVFTKHGYFTTPEQAFQYVGEEKPVGGEYVLPAEWVNK
jgi:molybdate transport system substrate-binding protein